LRGRGRSAKYEVRGTRYELRAYNLSIDNPASERTTNGPTIKRLLSFPATLYRELRDCYKIFRPEWDWWRWGLGFWFDVDLDPGFDWTHVLFFMHLGPFRLTVGLEDND
jgi:hypothetical protein